MNPTRFFSEMSSAIATRVGERGGREIVVAGERIDAGVYWRKIWDGITGVVQEVRSMRKEFESSIRPGDTRQMIGMNDVLDATRKIDLIDVRYQPLPDGMRVSDVRLVQVKRGGKSLEEIERRNIHAEHTDYVASLVEREAYARTLQRQEAVEYVGSGAFAREFEGREKSNAEVLAFLRGQFDLFVVDLLAGTSVSVQGVEQTWQQATHPTSKTMAKLFFAHPNASELVLHIADMVGEFPSNVGRVMGALRQWAVLEPATSAELYQAHPTWKLDPAILEAARFHSVIREGGVETAKPIDVKEAKALRSLTGRP